MTQLVCPICRLVRFVGSEKCHNNAPVVLMHAWTMVVLYEVYEVIAAV